MRHRDQGEYVPEISGELAHFRSTCHTYHVSQVKRIQLLYDLIFLSPSLKVFRPNFYSLAFFLPADYNSKVRIFLP